MLRVDNLQAGQLPPITFEVANGECLVIEGPSGAGKTRLLRALADLDPAPGQIFLEGAERREMKATAWRRLFRYQSAEPAWWTDTARGSLGAAATGSTRIDRLLTSLGLDQAMLDRPLATLSTGERLRLALVRSLADEPQVIALDEPTAALDAGSAALVEELIRYQKLAGRIVILVSHDEALRNRLADARLMLPAPRSVPQTAGAGA